MNFNHKTIICLYLFGEYNTNKLFYLVTTRALQPRFKLAMKQIDKNRVITHQIIAPRFLRHLNLFSMNLSKIHINSHVTFPFLFILLNAVIFIFPIFQMKKLFLEKENNSQREKISIKNILHSQGDHEVL